MEQIDIFNAFKNIIEQSRDEYNKIYNITRSELVNKLIPYLSEAAEKLDVPNPVNNYEILGKFIDILKVERPGYVFQDLINIIQLGADEVFGDVLRLDGKTLYKWYCEYGKNMISKERLSTKRNQWLGDVYKVLSKQPEWLGKYVSIEDLMEKYGKSFKSEFPTITNILKGKIELKQVPKVPVTWVDDPLNK